MEDKRVKLVYEDKGKSKVIRGILLKENEFTFEILSEFDNKVIIIGKRALIQLMPLNRNNNLKDDKK